MNPKSILDKDFKYRNSVDGHTPEAFARRMKAYGRLAKRQARAAEANVTPLTKRRAAK